MYQGHMCMYTKYKVSMYNPVPGGVCTDANTTNAANSNDDGQSMIV